MLNIRVGIIYVSLLCVIIFSYVSAYAQPNVTGISGSAAHSYSVTISGTAFGTKPTAAPIKFDNFEGGADGASISTGGYWSVSNIVNYNDDNTRSGSTMHARAELTDSANSHFYNHSMGGSRGGKVLLHFWVRNDYISGSCPYQLKLIRMTYTYAHVSGPTFGYDIWVRQDEPGYWPACNEQAEGYSQNYDSSQTLIGTFYPPNVDGTRYSAGHHDEQKWYQMMVLIDEGTQDGGDGALKIYMSHDDGTAPIGKTEDTTYGWLVSGDNKYLDGVILGYILANEDVGTSVHTYWDDVYIDKYWQRVEIGNNAVYENSTHREIQIPTAWADNEITFTVNRGSFDPCETYYLYVVDADDNVNTHGYPIMIVTGAGETPCEVPSPPSGLEIVE